MRFSANGQPLRWQRDPLEMFVFHLDIPAGMDKLDVALDFILPTKPHADLGAASPSLFVLEWNDVVLYPTTMPSDEVRVLARIRLPAGWKFECALPVRAAEKDTVDFEEVSLTTLVDSPLLSGKYFREVALTDGDAPVSMAIVADSPEALAFSSEWQAHYRRMVREAEALFGARHYLRYKFLLALSDELGEDGIEHHESSDNRLSERTFLEESRRVAYAYLLPHEYIHSWNGKYRRPAGLVTRNYQEPQTGELLWIYEGLTRYLNWVVAARSGLLTPEQARDYAALLAAVMDHRSGREWRSLEDTAVSGQILYAAPDEWQSLRRSVDYYDESLLIWLEADMIIRRATAGQKSLDDFCRAFYGPPSGPPGVRPYGLDDVTTALGAVAPHDWKSFFERRLNATGVDNAPLEGLKQSGWNLGYGTTMGPILAARSEVHQTVEERFSIGLLLRMDGTIVDVVRDSPGWRAGLGPGMRVLTVNDRPWAPQTLREAIAADGNSALPIRLLVQNQSLNFRTEIEDHRGLQYPRLERNANPDTLSDILRPSSSTSQGNGTPDGSTIQ